MEQPAGLVMRPEWLRISQAVTIYGLSRSTLYNLIGAGKIKSSVPRTGHAKAKTGINHGARLISAASLDAFISRFATGGDESPAATKTAKRSVVL